MTLPPEIQLEVDVEAALLVLARDPNLRVAFLAQQEIDSLQVNEPVIRAAIVKSGEQTATPAEKQDIVRLLGQAARRIQNG